MSLLSHNRKEKSVKAAIIASLALVFVLDVLIPLDVSIGAPYVAVVLLTLWLTSRQHIFLTAGAITALGIVGVFFPLDERDDFGMAVLNRLIALFVVWVTAILGNLLLREQEATRQQRDFNESLLETASSIILVLDTSARIVYFNHATTDYLGYELRQVAGQDWFDACVSEQDRPRARGLFQLGLETGTARDGQFSLMTRSGQELQFTFSSKPMRDGEDKVTQVLLIGQDVTAILETQRRMVATERLAAIGQTIATVAHESNNELMALKLAIDMLSGTVTEPKSQHLIEHMQSSHARLQRLLKDVRHFAGPLHLERSTCSVKDIWQKAWQSLKTARKDREAELHETIKCNSLKCDCDALRIEQVFRNLFENSLAACSDPVWIEIQASEDNQNGQSFLRISVKDNGPGLTPEAKAKIFEPFFTTKQRGTGLGMPISQRILQAHGGDLCLSNTNKRGAEFVLLLPLEETAKPVEAGSQL